MVYSDSHMKRMVELDLALMFLLQKVESSPFVFGFQLMPISNLREIGIGVCLPRVWV